MKRGFEPENASDTFKAAYGGDGTHINLGDDPEDTANEEADLAGEDGGDSSDADGTE